MAHWIGHSKLKTSYYNGFLEHKRIINQLEATFTGAPIDAKNTEVSVVGVQANDNEDIIPGSKASKINEASDEM